MEVRRMSVLVGCLFLTGCGTEIEFSSGSTLRQGIVNGTRDPQMTFLTAGQIAAIGFLAGRDGEAFCSGTLVATRIVATARHCVTPTQTEELYFGFGVQPATPQALIPVVAIYTHPTIDYAVLVLGDDPAKVVTDLTPIAMNRDPVDAHWMGRWLDASGFGDTYSSATGRFFAKEEIVEFDATTVTVWGHGEQGICYGDSGGPIIWQPTAADPPVVVGTEQYGDSSCVDYDTLTRVDVVAGWTDEIIAQPLPPPLEPCGSVGLQGECDGSVRLACDSAGYLRRDDCSLYGMSCGYLGTTFGYTCLPGTCGQTDYRGRCEGNTLYRCRQRGLEAVNCDLEHRTCGLVDEATGYACTGCTLCAGQCEDLTTSTRNCGDCGVRCAPAHATGQCVAGACQIKKCDESYSDRDLDASNGCEFHEGGCAAVAPHALSAAGVFLLLLSIGRKRLARHAAS